jgi:hypothetical protein
MEQFRSVQDMSNFGRLCAHGLDLVLFQLPGHRGLREYTARKFSRRDSEPFHQLLWGGAGQGKLGGVESSKATATLSQGAYKSCLPPMPDLWTLAPDRVTMSRVTAVSVSLSLLYLRLMRRRCYHLIHLGIACVRSYRFDHRDALLCSDRD